MSEPTTTDILIFEAGPVGALHDIIAYFQGYVMIVVMFVGFLGNCVSLLVFYRARRRNDATIHYLSTLAVSDSCCIVFVGLALWMANGLKTVTDGKTSINTFQYSSFSCKIQLYLFLVLQSISAWIIAIFSLERAVVVWFPLKRASITGTNRRGFLILVCLSLSLVCIYTAILSDVTEHEGTKQCFSTDPSLWLFLTLVENSLFYFIPGSIIFAANLSIVLGIVTSRRNMAAKMGAHSKESQDTKSLVNLLIVSAMYIVFMTPSTVTWTYFIFATQQPIDQWYAVFLSDLGHLFHQWSMINYCFNFIVYSTSLPFFQAELKAIAAMLRCCHPKENSG
jgi:hypothetical protein